MVPGTSRPYFMQCVKWAVRMIGNNSKLKMRNRMLHCACFAAFFVPILIICFYLYQRAYPIDTLEFVDDVTSLKKDLMSTVAASSDHIFYGIIFDAGSTGSRIHVFKFQQTKDNPYKLLGELFLLVKPGLSAYASEPRKAADSLRDMLNQAKQYIPEAQWSTTPIALKATAGLRLLSKEAADNILNEVRQLFKEYPFKMNENSVSILEGDDEGLFSWLTVNYLQGALGDVRGMFGVLDLGGGSTQITFIPIETATVQAAPEDYVADVELFTKSHKIYTHSYLGLGMNAGRFQILGGNKTAAAPDSRVYVSACLPTNYTGKWQYDGKEYMIGGTSAVKSRYESCYGSVRGVVAAANIHKPTELPDTAFAAISYYFDKAADVKLISGDGGNVTVQQFFDAAQRECSHVTDTDAFLCMDLCYISSLLQDGYGFRKTSLMLMKKKLKSFEIAWPLGAIFDLYGEFNRSRRKR